MKTNHIENIKFTEKGWIITMRSGAIISCGLNLAEALEKLDVWPQPELSVTLDITKTELLKVA
jgi:hypothetical protein